MQIDYIIEFDIAAIILNLMLILIIYLRRTYPTKLAILYKTLLWLNLISACTDLGSACLVMYFKDASLLINFADNMLYVSAHSLSAVIFLLYVIVMIRGNHGTKGEKIFWISAIIVEQLVALTAPLTKNFLGGVFHFDEYGYHRGNLMIIIYVFSIAILLYSVYLLVKHHKKLTRYQNAVVISFLGLMIGSIIAQLFYERLLIEPFCAAISFLMMNNALDNPTLYFYRGGNCFNKNAFDNTVAKKMNRGERFIVIAFSFDDFTLFKKNHGEDLYRHIVYYTVNTCHKMFGRKNVYTLTSNCFAIDYKGNVQKAIDKINENVGKNIPLGNGKTFNLTAHFCVFTHPGFVTTPGEVYDSIQNMLYTTYAKTGNKVIYVNSQMMDSVHRESQIMHRLHQAIANDGFEVFYQPIYHYKSGKFISAEALLRMKDVEGEIRVGPDEFIPVAEQSGLVIEIGEIVLEKVCKFCHDNDLGKLGIEYIEVNLSLLQLLNLSTVERIVDICAKYGISPAKINFEITETATASESERENINICMSYLRSKGFKFSLDDYGTGYSTITYLAEMPFELVKVDKNVLWSAMKDNNFHIILKSTVALIREFGKECLVEGVENDAMVDTLVSLGCDYLQGYFYSKPVPESKMIEFLQNNK